jgi:hypothetical protein
VGSRVVSLSDYRRRHAAEKGQAARGPSRGVRAKKPHPDLPRARQRLTGSYVDSFYPAEMRHALPQKVSPMLWDPKLIVPAVALLWCLAVLALGL